jgi:integrase
MPLRIVRRKSTGALTISGSVGGIRVQRRAASDDPKLAAEEAATLEVEILRGQWHGERRGGRTFAEAALSYLAAAERSESTKARVRRLVVAIGKDVKLRDVDQDMVVRLRSSMLRPSASPSTVERGIIVPLRAILRHAHRRGWCDLPAFEIPRRAEGRTRYLLPAEAERLIANAAPHLKPLILFLLTTGSRMSEAIELNWPDVDLIGARVIF